MAGRLGDCGIAAKHQSDLSGLWACVGRQSSDASTIHVRGMRIRESSRLGRRDQYLSGRTCRIGLWRNGAVRPSDEAGTRRSDSSCPCSVSAVGVSGIYAGEDVNEKTKEVFEQVVSYTNRSRWRTSSAEQRPRLTLWRTITQRPERRTNHRNHPGSPPWERTDTQKPLRIDGPGNVDGSKFRNCRPRQATHRQYCGALLTIHTGWEAHSFPACFCLNAKPAIYDRTSDSLDFTANPNR